MSNIIPKGRIQFKGTDICMDVDCSCGETFHVDGYFAYNIECPHCGIILNCNNSIELKETTKEEAGVLLVKGFDD